MLLQFFISIEQDSSLMIIVPIVLKSFQHMVKVKNKKKCLQIISIERPTVGAKYYLLIFCVGFLKHNQKDNNKT